MAAKNKCHVCQQRKGKRPCPARSAPICPRCCAQHRVVEIPCPSDCAFLGAEGSVLLATRQGADAPLPTVADVNAFVGELVQVGPRGRLMDEAEPAALSALSQLVELVDEQDEDAILQDAIWEWLVYGARDRQGGRLVDRIVTKLPRALTEAERSVLRGLHDCRYGLFTITDLPGPHRAAVRDVLADQALELVLHDVAGKHQTGQTLACFVTRTAQGTEVLSGAWQLPPGGEERFPLRLREIRDETSLAEVPLPDFLSRLAILVPLLMFEHFGEQDADQPDLPSTRL